MRRHDVAAWVGCLALLGPVDARAQAPAGANRAEHAKLRAEVIRLRTEVEMLQLDFDLARADLLEDLKLIKGMAMAGDLMSAFGGARSQAPAGDAKAREAEAKKEQEDEKEREAAKASFVAERKKELAKLAESLASKRLDLEDAERRYREPAAGVKLGADVDPPRPAGEVPAVGAVSLAGFDPGILAYFSAAPQAPEKAPSFDGKKVVVATSVAPGTFADPKAMGRDLDRELMAVIRKGFKGVEIVDPRKVHDWAEAYPTWNGAGEIAKAFEADYVVHPEVQSFSIRDPRRPNLLEGNAEVIVRITEYARPKAENGQPNTSAPKEIKQVYEDTMTLTFPKDSPIPIELGVSPASFRAKFLELLATEISWNLPGIDWGAGAALARAASPSATTADKGQERRMERVEEKLDRVLRSLRR